MKMWVIKEVAQARYNTCKLCDRFVPTTSRCVECGCFMKIKVKVARLECPLKKWGSDNGNA